MKDKAQIEALLGEIVLGLEASPDFDLEGFLSCYPEEAEGLRERVAALRHLGLLGRNVRATEDRASSESTGHAFEKRYEIRAQLGTGAMGRVVRAMDCALGREVAIKFLEMPAKIETKEERERWHRRFLREAHLAASLQHPGIAAVHDLGTTADGRAYFTMRLVEGRSLEERLRSVAEGDPEATKELTLVRRIQIVQRICEALSHAHGSGILHRDLKPSNVMLGPQGEVLVLDWGLARRLIEEEEALPDKGSPSPGRGSSLLTASGTVIGTPSYLAPEQARGEPADIRSDVFGIGAVLHHLLTGRPPYWGAHRDEVLQRAKTGSRNDPRLRRAPRRVPPALVAICSHALAPDPERRYRSVDALNADLQAYLEDRQGAAWRDPIPTRLAKLVRRNPGGSANVATAFLGLVLAVALGMRVIEAHERDRAELEERIVTELPRVREFGARYATSSDSLDYALWAREWLAKFRDVGIDLEGEGAAERVRDQLAELESHQPQASAAVRRALYDLGSTLIRCGALYAWMEEHGQPILAHPRLAASVWAPILKRYHDLPNKDPGLSDLWPRFQGILAAVETDSWRREVWEASVAWWQRREDRIGDLFERGQERDPEDLVWLGMIVSTVRGREQSLPILERAAWLGRSSFWAHFQLGLAYDALASDPGHVQKAIQHDLAATALNPESAWAHTNLGKSFIDRAVEFSNQAQNAQGDERARLMREHDDNKRLGIESYERALTINPTLAAAHNNMANVIATERPEEAERHHRVAIEAEPCNYASLVSYASFLQRMGRSDEELEMRKRVCDCYPDRADSRGDLAMLHHERGNKLLSDGDQEGSRREFEQAVAVYRDTLKLQPDSLYMGQNLGLALLLLGRLEEGLGWLEQSVQHRAEDLASTGPRIPPAEHMKRLKELLDREPIRNSDNLLLEKDLAARLERLLMAVHELLSLSTSNG